jgi:hypothetical protein
MLASRPATLKHAREHQLFWMTVIKLSVADVSKNFLNRSTFIKPRSQMDYQDVYSKHAQTNWKVHSLTFTISP